MDEITEDMDIAAAMGFGSFGGTKRRKFDHGHAPKARSDASGANSTKLGVRSKNTERSKGDLAEASNPGLDTPGTSGKPSDNKDASSSSSLAAFLATSNALPAKPSDTQHAEDAPLDNTVAKTESISFGGASVTKAELDSLRSGVKNADGDTAYFLPSFVEDVWEKLLRNRST